MASTKTSMIGEPSRRGDDQARRTLLSKCENPRHYGPGSALYSKLLDLNYTPSMIDDVGRRAYITTGPTPRSELIRLDLVTSENRLIVPLFLQLYSNMKRSSSTISRPVSAEQAITPEEKVAEVEYRRRQMEFCNECRLPVPRLIGVEKEGPLQVDGGFAVGLITVFLDGAMPHELDILASNYRLEQIGLSLQDSLLTSHMRKKLLDEQDAIKQLKFDIPDSILDTQNAFAVVGTYNLMKEENKELLKLMEEKRYWRFSSKKDPVLAFRLGKTRDYFKKAYRWHCEVRRNQNVDPTEATRTFTELILPLLQPSLRKEAFVYQQGDEFPHNYQYGFIPHRGAEDLVSFVFDLDHACLDTRERSMVKTLLPPYMDLDYDGVSEKVIKSNERLGRLLMEADEKIFVTLEPRLAYIKEDPNKALLYFDLTAIDETICMIGRSAQDERGNAVSTNRRWTMVPPYSNQIVFKQLMKKLGSTYHDLPTAVPLNMLRPRLFIKRLKDGLAERITRMIDGKTPYGKISDEIRRSLEGLMGLSKEFEFDAENGGSS